jgi:hypothetical protein
VLYGDRGLEVGNVPRDASGEGLWMGGEGL